MAWSYSASAYQGLGSGGRPVMIVHKRPSPHSNKAMNQSARRAAR